MLNAFTFTRCFCFDYQIQGEILLLLSQTKNFHRQIYWKIDRIDAAIAFTLPSVSVDFVLIASTHLLSTIPIPNLIEQTQECDIKEHVNCGKVKRELQFQIYELRVLIHELRVQIYELRVQFYELRVQIYNLRVQAHELRV